MFPPDPATGGGAPSSRVDPPGAEGGRLQVGTQRLGVGDLEGSTHHRRGTGRRGAREDRKPGGLPGGGVHEDAPAGPGGAGGARSAEGWGGPGRGESERGGTSRTRRGNGAAAAWRCDAHAGHWKSQGDQALPALLPEGLPEQSGVAQPRCAACPPDTGWTSLPLPSGPLCVPAAAPGVFLKFRNRRHRWRPLGRRLADSGRRLRTPTPEGGRADGGQRGSPVTSPEQRPQTPQAKLSGPGQGPGSSGREPPDCEASPHSSKQPNSGDTGFQASSCGQHLGDHPPPSTQQCLGPPTGN